MGVLLGAILFPMTLLIGGMIGYVIKDKPARLAPKHDCIQIHNDVG